MESNVSTVKLYPLKELLEDSLEEQQSLPSDDQVRDQTWLRTIMESDMISSKAPGYA